ncbi:transcription factor-like protein DPB isoform X1 [Dioscorea cayenensis subsp. rotundata]|uniref:Transcription factor-like protein DPB isoform X1 n=1 Tax=Dioscorea cayennensis subsp. rotundata TaxID=55577 RepID=A0AB40B298_DIOCR|nr:transcription factor-like protein DPB isoform X1 [Dioscorea cayenensis subsp. rotundata]XP_039121391.1 transcription factor-like protein DPB isoform X1 [Dioscorea cayenensis subsp. rotundata]XP_039121392.1 transcription factor-like protein DPB isoform X1 [Dioscorea cayenensis subsp. rotundata]XP_039121393.1 transcription factor-like protein DPB isoform X1 [Dioscorea cayenensis subsp. rotundata]
MTSTSCENSLRLNDLYIKDDDKCEGSNDAVKKKKASRIVGWGLRRFSTIVCKKIEAKGRTTYNEVADEIIADLASLAKNITQVEGAGSNMDQMCLSEHFDEKNIRRRVYDAFNVLMAINVIAKDKKEIRWIGFPTTRTEELDELKKLHINVMNRVQAKANFLKELEDQFINLQTLILRNQRLSKSGAGHVPSEGIALPFLLVRTRPQATVEIEISEDMSLVHFDFNGTPFTLHDDAAILKAMKCPHSLEIRESSQGLSEGSSSITDRNGNPLKPVSFSWNSENLTS